MRLGIGTYAYAWNIGVAGYPSPAKPMRHQALLEEAIRLGAGAVQYCENLSLLKLTIGELRELESQAESAGIRLEVGTRGINADEILRLAELAERFGSGFVRLVMDQPGDHPTPAEAVLRLLPIVAAMSPIKLAIENHDRFPAKVLGAMVEELGAAVCLDSANSLGCHEGFEAVVEVLAPHTVCLHLKDVSIERVDSGMGFDVRGTALGKGGIPFDEILVQVLEHGQLESAIIELWSEWREEATFDAERKLAELSFRAAEPLFRVLAC